MLPDSNYGPTGGLKYLVCLTVTLDVAFELDLPVLPVHSRLCTMTRTGMPVAPIHEDRYTCTYKHNVGLPAKMNKGAEVHSIAQTQTPQHAPQRQFRRGISPSDGLHPATHRRARSERLHLLHRRETLAHKPLQDEAVLASSNPPTATHGGHRGLRAVQSQPRRGSKVPARGLTRPRMIERGKT